MRQAEADTRPLWVRKPGDEGRPSSGDSLGLARPSTCGRRETYVLFAVVVLATSLGNLSQTGLNAMLGIVCFELAVPTAVGQWLATGYIFTLGVVVPLSSYLMGRFRMKDLVLGAIGLFLAGSVVASLSQGFSFVLAGRLMQAVSAGVLMPVIQTLAMTRFPAGRRATAMGVSGIAMGFAPNIGPTIGGVLVDAFGWRSFFVLLAVLSALIFVCCLVLVERWDDASFPAGVDLPSFVLSAAGFGGLLVGATEASSFGFSSMLVWAPAFVGLLCLLLFVRRQRALEHPLVDVAIFRSLGYRWSFAASCLLFASFMSVTLLIPLYVEGFRGGSALQAGMVLLPATIVALVVNPVAGWLTDRLGARPVARTASLFLFAGAFSMAFCDADTPMPLLMAMQTLRAIGVSGLIGPLTSWGLSELSGRRLSDGSAFVTLGRQVSASIGTALLVLCVEAGTAAFSGPVPYQMGFALSAAFAAGTALCVFLRVHD